MKALLALEGKNGRQVIDRAFLAEHTAGYEALVQDLKATKWKDIERCSGLTRREIESAGKIYANAKNVIFCYGMGLTPAPARRRPGGVQQLANLMLMRGQMGTRARASARCAATPTCRATAPSASPRSPMPSFSIASRRRSASSHRASTGHGAVEAIKAMAEGHSKALVCMGGNLRWRCSDPEVCFDAMRKLDLAAGIATKLNRSHLLLPKRRSFFPCLGRTELDEQETGPQSVTVELDVGGARVGRASETGLPDLDPSPPSVAGIAKATLPNSKVNSTRIVADYNTIRDAIEKVFPAFADFNERVRVPGGFRLHIAASERQWLTTNGKADFIVFDGLDCDARAGEPEALMLATVRSHDQYNTTIYGFNDRYRGITGRRDVIFMHKDDLEARGLSHGDLIDVEAIADLRATPERRACCATSPRSSSRSPGIRQRRLVQTRSARRPANFDARSGTPAYKSIPVRVCVQRQRPRPKRHASWRTPSPPPRLRASLQRESPALLQAGLSLRVRWLLARVTALCPMSSSGAALARPTVARRTRCAYR